MDAQKNHTIPCPSLHSNPSRHPLRDSSRGNRERKSEEQLKEPEARLRLTPRHRVFAPEQESVKRKRDLFPGSRTSIPKVGLALPPVECHPFFNPPSYTVPAPPPRPREAPVQKEGRNKGQPKRFSRQHSVHPSGSGILTGFPFGTGAALCLIFLVDF